MNNLAEGGLVRSGVIGREHVQRQSEPVRRSAPNRLDLTDGPPEPIQIPVAGARCRDRFQCFAAMEFGGRTATLADVGWAAEDGQARLAVEDVRQSLPKKIGTT